MEAFSDDPINDAVYSMPTALLDWR